MHGLSCDNKMNNFTDLGGETQFCIPAVNKATLLKRSASSAMNTFPLFVNAQPQTNTWRWCIHPPWILLLGAWAHSCKSNGTTS